MPAILDISEEVQFSARGYYPEAGLMEDCLIGGHRLGWDIKIVVELQSSRDTQCMARIQGFSGAMCSTFMCCMHVDSVLAPRGRVHPKFDLGTDTTHSPVASPCSKAHSCPD